MRIPSGSTDRPIYFVAVDATDLKTRETGYGSTGWTVYGALDDGTAAVFTTPTVAEPDATNMPGVYRLLLDEQTTLTAGHDSEELCVHITHAGMEPVTRVVEIYRPKATEGETLSASGGAVGANVLAVSGDTNAADNLELFFDGTGYAAANSTIGTVTTNTDLVTAVAVRTEMDSNSTGLAAIETDTQDIQARLPAVLVGGRIDANAGAISGDVPAADNLELFFDGTGYAAANSTVGTVTTNTDMRGTDNALLATSAPTNFGDLSITVTTGRVDVASIEGVDATDQVRDSIVDDATRFSGANIDATVSSRSTVTTAEVGTEVDTALADVNLDHLVGTASPGNPPAGTYLDIMLDDGTATYDRTTDSLQVIRDRGDAAWITGGGGGITDILNVQPVIPVSIDLANTATVRLGFMLTNAVDDLPSTAEITPGTIDIDRKARGGTSWSAIVTAGACSEQAGMIYYDEVFDSGTGYAEGDSIRATFKSQKITVSANDYEITDANGVMWQTYIREAAGSGASAADVRIEMDANSAQLTAIVADTQDIQSRIPAALVGGRIDANAGAISGDAVAADNAEAWFDGTGYAAAASTVGTVTTNSDMRGTDNAATAAALATVDTEVGQVKAVTDVIPDSGAMTSIATAAALATVDTEVGQILADTGTDGVVIAAAQTVATVTDVTNQVTADVTGISGSATAADNLEASALGVVSASVNDASASTTAFVTTLASAVDDHYIGRVMVFTSGTLAGQATDITDYVGASKTVTVTALTSAPANSVTFVVV